MPWRLPRLVLFGAGAVLFAVLIARNDPAALVQSVSQLSWRLLIIVVFPFSVVNVFDTLGWRFAFRRDRVPFGRLFSARLAGEAFNLTTPTASVGGEAVKAWLLRPWVGWEESAPSVIVAKTTITIAQGLLLLVGILFAVKTLPVDSRLLRAMEVLLVLEVLAVGGFVLVQLGGVLGGGARLLRQFGVGGEAGGGALGRVDHALGSFYRHEPVRLSLSIVFHFLGWLVSALETWLIVRLLGMEVSLVTALVIEAFSTGIRFATFMVPGSLGALEGGHVATFAALGLGAPAGLSFSIVRRVREAAWVGIGFVLLVGFRAAAAPALET